MVTPIEEVRKALDRANPEDIQVSRLADGSLQIIITESEKNPPIRKGKWARVADELASEDLLRDGLGSRLRQQADEFRKSILLKPPTDT